MNFSEVEAAWSPRLLGLLRIVTAILFMEHGAQKLLGFPPSDHGSPELLSLLGAAGILELAGGFFILIGLFTRPVAFVLAGEMAVAYFQVWFPQSFVPTSNGGVSTVLYCFLFLYLMFAGAGPWGLDARIAHARFGEGADIAGIRPRATERPRGEVAA
jgi:putative oxidoreductase